MPAYIALVKAPAVKAQVCSVPPDSDAAMSHWESKPGTEIFAGFYSGTAYSEQDAAALAADKLKIDPRNIRIIAVGFDKDRKEKPDVCDQN